LNARKTPAKTPKLARKISQPGIITQRSDRFSINIVSVGSSTFIDSKIDLVVGTQDQTIHSRIRSIRNTPQRPEK